MEIIKLNNKQKQFLVDNEYVTTKSLDSLTHKGWEKYFIDNFEWSLDLHKNKWRMNDLTLFHKGEFEYLDMEYNLLLNFQNKDLQALLNIK